MLPAGRLESPNLTEAATRVQPDGCLLGTADHSNHLPEAEFLRLFTQMLEQSLADALPLALGVDVDAVLTGPGVGGAVSELGGIRIADNSTVCLGNNKGPIGAADPVKLGQRVGRRRRVGVVGRRSVNDVMRVNCSDRRCVLLGYVPQHAAVRCIGLASPQREELTAALTFYLRARLRRDR